MSDDYKNNYSKENEQPDKKEDGFVKGVSKEAKDVVDHTVDTSGKIIKSITGEGGLIGKTIDSSGNIVKKASDKGSDVIGKTVYNSSKAFKSIKDKTFNRKK
ncbi:hypothetical protein GCM10010954_11410 [Halobacillus andaensis]|uniref:Uncharacterized protein n=1 Tax=Halobacillus andaensis TaxID=1176239 RepID=A0A917B1R2_HALAA|nr:hypothetical protein [Halobacillus andaensis]MBP2003937.1 hypothetical protein [Halobacillus andaensis]GGF14506.1 hypothetical protein GCM10010954_11410 [Halobacillus andaensis]